MKNEIKKQVVESLLKTFSKDIVKKGVGRAERWIKAAYGEIGVVGYKARLDESNDMEDMINFFYSYCHEAKTTQEPGAKTFNRESFGIYRRTNK